MGQELKLNRRKEDRYPMSENIYVVIHTQPPLLGQMVQISPSGLAFTFVDLDAVSQRLIGMENVKLDLFAGGEGYFMQGLACRLTSNIDITSTTSFSSVVVKRVGVEFPELSFVQQVKINTLIRRQHHQYFDNRSGSQHAISTFG